MVRDFQVGYGAIGLRSTWVEVAVALWFLREKLID